MLAQPDAEQNPAQFLPRLGADDIGFTVLGHGVPPRLGGRAESTAAAVNISLVPRRFQLVKVR
ncbi:hypothetical protein Ntsu_73120 [Nocardia sp. IFM 10818]